MTLQVLARQQAQREEELAQSQRHILALQVSYLLREHQYSLEIVPSLESDVLIQEEIEELERENRLHSQQVCL